MWWLVLDGLEPFPCYFLKRNLFSLDFVRFILEVIQILRSNCSFVKITYAFPGSLVLTSSGTRFEDE